GLQIVGRKANILVNAINELRSFGLDHVVPLPELVLVGDQSAGKSSLMSALAEIQLPKSEGICTRCPASIQTLPANEWTCKVSLEKKFAYQPDLRQYKPTKERPFPPWVERNQVEVNDFKTIRDKNELEVVMKWAQIALLNPNANFEEFIPMSGARVQADDQRTEERFSPNVVRIEIAGPGLPSLLFYDLPGIFQAASRPEEKYLIKAFEQLATRYIMRRNALIICAIQMRTDPSNSRTSAVIGDLKANSRCIGVLTMPDQLQGGQKHPEFEAILKGDAHCFGHGYFVTKQPGPDTKLSGPTYHIDARREEEEFFDTAELWAGDWAVFRERCGTAAIQKYLSQEFARQIAASIPDATQKIAEKINEVEGQLSLLPAPLVDNVQHIVRRKLFEFSSSIQRLLDGSSQDYGGRFQSDWNTLCIQFRDAVTQMRPGCVCSHPSDLEFEIINLDDDEDDIDAGRRDSLNTSPNKRQSDADTPNSASKRARTNDAGIPMRSSATPGPGAAVKNENRGQYTSPPPLYRRPQSSVINPFDKPYLRSGKGAMSLADIRACIARHSRTGAPTVVNLKVMEEYSIQSVHSWDKPLETLIDHTLLMLRAHVSDILQRTLGQYRETDLYKSSEQFIRELIDEEEREQRADLREFYETECHQLFTINDEVHELYKAKELNVLMSQRRIRRVQCEVDKRIRLGKKLLTDEAKEAEKKKITDSELGPDPFQREIDTAAYIRGYYALATVRFTDSVCANINARMFKRIHRKIAYFLEAKLGLDEGNEKCRMLLEERADIAYRRRDLQNELGRLYQFSGRLRKLAEDAGFVDNDGEDVQDSVESNGNEDQEMSSI
ncbi:P-loop containing nucleoside triphosphate hydrolase protein, partial [Xylogone sp. PMI_703]